MNYEEKYNQALERARKLAADLPNGRNDRLYHVWDLENIFPELKEEEDERIRKAIVKIISDIDGGFPFEKYGIIKKDAISWLEKQGEQKPVELLKDLPKWKKATKHEDLEKHIAILEENKVLLSNYLEEGDYYIELDDLKTLPKEK